MEIKADEITEILKRQLEGYEKTIDVAEVGTVLSVGDGIARAYGLDKAMAGELIDFGHDLYGLALNLEEDNVGIVLLGESYEVKEGQEVQEPVQTGLKAIDAMIPIGRGQRELIIGDRQTGKTAVAIDTIINQKGK